MKIAYVQRVGNGVGTVDFETKNDGSISITRYHDGTIYINADNVTFDEVLEAIEIVKSGKLVIDL